MAQLLQPQVEAGRTLLAETPRDEAHYHELDEEYTRWNACNIELLRRAFDNDSYAEVYSAFISYSTPMRSTYRDWWENLQLFTRERIGRLEGIRVRLDLIPQCEDSARDSLLGAQAMAPLRTLDLTFVEDERLKATIASDYIEAQLALAAGSSKAAAILAASAIEGLFLNAMSRGSVQELPDFQQATKRLRRDGEIAWDRAQLDQLVAAAVELGLVQDRMRHHGQGARDARDTVHPYNEIRNGRASEREARILLELMPEFAEDLTSET